LLAGVAHRRAEEHFKMLYDLSKHLTTLGTVAAVIVVSVSQGARAVFGPLIVIGISVLLALGAMRYMAAKMLGAGGFFFGSIRNPAAILQVASVALLILAVAWFAVVY
jgi:hypothetical protein